MADPKKAAKAAAVRYADHKTHFRDHFKSNYKSSGKGSYSDYEPAYRSGLRYGSDSEYAGRSFADLEPEMRRHHEKKHGENTWKKVKAAARHAFKRGRSHRTGTTTSSSSSQHSSGVSGPSGSSQTASGGPGSVVRGDDA